MQKLSQEKEKNISEVDKYKNEFKRVEKEKEEFVAKFNDNFKLLEVVRLENEKQSRQIKRYSDENEELLQKVDILDQDFQDEKIASAKLYEKITEKDRQIEEQSANFQRRLLDEQKVILELRSKIEASEADVHSTDEQLLQKVDALEKDLRSERIANEKLHAEIKEKDRQTEEQSVNFERRLLDEQKVILELRSKIEVSEAQAHSKDEELLQKVDALEKDLQNEKIANEKLHSEIKEKDGQLENFEGILKDEQNIITELKAEIEVKNQNSKIQEDRNNELMSEIRQMNEELMQRGTKISAQEESISKLKQTVITKENLLKEAQEEVSYLKEQSLNKTIDSNADDSRSEIMSTSTISRVEESSRMADLESSFEDRYSKLKIIAIKLKKKAHEQEKQIKELQQVKIYFSESFLTKSYQYFFSGKQ